MIALERRMRLAQTELQQLASTDALTGLLNRRAGGERIRQEAHRVERGLQGLSILLADVDHFKGINDRYGHGVGDQVLACVAQRLEGACRPYDSVVRWGGEEFLILCPGAHPDRAEAIAGRFLLAVGPQLEIPPYLSLPVTISVGAVGIVSGTASDPSSWVAAADTALYEAKAAGRNCFRVGQAP